MGRIFRRGWFKMIRGFERFPLRMIPEAMYIMLRVSACIFGSQYEALKKRCR
jgi:hypothetical protein